MSPLTQTDPTETKPAPAYSPGLEGVIAGETGLCQVDEGAAGLRYCGYAVTDLAEYSTFEEVAFLLLHGNLPTQNEQDDFDAALQMARRCPEPIATLLLGTPAGAHPMDVLRSAMSVLGMIEPDEGDRTHRGNLHRAIRLMGQMPVITGTAYRLMHGKSIEHPDPAMGCAAGLLFLLTGQRGDERSAAMARALDVSLILYAEHELNASTFAARVTASTLADLHGAVTAAIATLKGPLHGGANEAVAAMLEDIRSPERAESWVHEAMARKQRIMGFGHRVLKEGDVRSAIIRRHAEQLSRACQETRWFEIASTIDRIMQEEKGLYPNLDFYTAVAYLLMGIPRNWYTPLFVCSRLSGWCAHIIEQQDHNRLIRPRALYTGPPPRPYVPLTERH